MTRGEWKTGFNTVLAIAAGTMMRLWFVGHAGRVDGDTLVYGNIAKNWLTHGVYGFSMSPIGPLPTLIRLPGYPIFLALCFRLFGLDNYVTVMHVQCAVDLCTCLLVSALAGRLFGRRAQIAALWLSALCPFTAAYVAAPLTEVLTLFTIALAFYALERWRRAGRGFNFWLAIIVIALACSILLRPEQGLLAATVVPAMVWMVQRACGRRLATAPLLPVLVTAFCIVLPLVPWATRNWRTFHVIQPLAPRYATDPGEPVPLGFQRWYRTWAVDFSSTEEVYWNYDNADILIGDLPSRAFDTAQQYRETAAILSEYNRGDSATADFDRRFAALAEERVRDHPIRYYVSLPVARVLNMLFRPRAELLEIPLEWWRWRQNARMSALAACLAVLNLAYFLFGSVGWWRWLRLGLGEYAPLAWAMTFFVVLRCALLLTLDNSEPRYTLEFFPILIVCGSFLFSTAHPSDG